MKLVKTVELNQSDYFVKHSKWLTECEKIDEKIKQETKTTVKSFAGYKVTHPSGFVENVAERNLPSWIKKVLPTIQKGQEKVAVPSPHGGTAYIEPSQWDIQYEELPRIEYPIGKHEISSGFDFSDRAQIATIVNQELGFSWTRFDARPEKDGSYIAIRRGEKLRTERRMEMRDVSCLIELHPVWVEVHIYKEQVLRIFPTAYQVYEREAEVEQSKYSPDLSESTSIESDGMWNK